MNELTFRKLLQKALQNNNLSNQEKILDLPTLLYRVRLYAECGRVYARLGALLKVADSDLYMKYTEMSVNLEKINDEYFDGQTNELP